jgi:hypothetical protein
MHEIHDKMRGIEFYLSFIPYEIFNEDAPMKRNTTKLPLFSVLLVLLAFSLAGCYLLQPTGPCFGVGCPSHTVGQNGQYKKGEGPKSQQPANARNSNSQPANAQNKDSQPAQSAPKEGNFFTNAWAKIARSR